MYEEWRGTVKKSVETLLNFGGRGCVNGEFLMAVCDMPTGRNPSVVIAEVAGFQKMF